MVIKVYILLTRCIAGDDLTILGVFESLTDAYDELCELYPEAIGNFDPNCDEYWFRYNTLYYYEIHPTTLYKNIQEGA